ncbi:MAG TPA: SET domain-containing protein-lysine N-methyltransferase [Candidatus Limnocylindrales bacterium]|nr:SET domain-containing protein-lysine N-methyltransferase [Candidatus Limnocylindrales bacterium]
MNKLKTSDKIYVAESKIPDSGRGVFARIGIKKNEVIESCPVIEVPPHDVANLSESVLVTYFYYLGKNKERVLITLGFGAIYNHTYTPNAMYEERLNAGLIDFVALKDISKDEEITVNYNSENSGNKNPLWFEKS